MKTIIFDVDGCLADFVLGFTKEVLKHVHSESAYSIVQPWGTRENKSRWDFSDVFTKKQVDDAWSRIKGSMYWWEKLPALEEPRVFDEINYLQRDHQVLFVTARVGLNPQRQTWMWLWNQGVEDPNVVVSDRKGEIASAVRADYHIDDKPENAACVHWMADRHPTKSYFLEHEYRQAGPWLPEKIRRVKSVREYIQDIKEEK